MTTTALALQGNRVRKALLSFPHSVPLERCCRAHELRLSNVLPRLRRAPSTRLAPFSGGSLGATPQSCLGWTPRLLGSPCLHAKPSDWLQQSRTLSGSIGAAPLRFARGHPLCGHRQATGLAPVSSASDALPHACFTTFIRSAYAAQILCSHPQNGCPRDKLCGAGGYAPHCATGSLGATLCSTTAFGLSAHCLWLPPPDTDHPGGWCGIGGCCRRTHCVLTLPRLA